MPILAWFFSAAFVAGIARALIVGLGVGITVFAFSSALIFELRQYLFPLYGYNWLFGIDYFFNATGMYRTFEMLISAYTARVALFAVKQFRIR